MARELEVLNIREAAAFLSAHEQTVRKLARRGAIPCFKVGRDWRFRKEALLRWTEEQQPGDRRPLVLVVDDDEKFCRAMSRTLDRFGCRVRFTTGGKEGLRLARQREPDLVLLDLKMPDLNGPRFLAELRKTHPDLPVVIVTGYSESELMQEASQYAPLMVLPKPVDRELLERTVRVATGKRAGFDGTRALRQMEA
jgi:excisionase family DNA binding protein